MSRLLLFVSGSLRVKVALPDAERAPRIVEPRQRIILPGRLVELLVEVPEPLRPTLPDGLVRGRGWFRAAVGDAHGSRDQPEGLFDHTRFGMTDGDVSVARVSGRLRC